MAGMRDFLSKMKVPLGLAWGYIALIAFVTNNYTYFRDKIIVFGSFILKTAGL